MVKLTVEDYRIKNRVERVVQLGVKQVLSEDKTACACPKCQADMQSLILNRLKPDYVPLLRDGAEEVEIIRLEELERDLFNRLMVEAYRALDKVKRAPRHEERRNELHNSQEEIALRALRDILKGENIQLDFSELSSTMAYILNNLEPKYTTTNKGNVYTRTVELDASYIAKVYSVVYNALAEVKAARTL